MNLGIPGAEGRDSAIAVSTQAAVVGSPMPRTSATSMVMISRGGCLRHLEDRVGYGHGHPVRRPP